MLVNKTYETPLQADLLAIVTTHLPEVIVLGTDVIFAIKPAKNTDIMPNCQAMLAFYRFNLEKYRNIKCSIMLYK